jgi:hypothetical protein
VSRIGRGERVSADGRTTVAELAERWFELKQPKLRARTSGYYRRSLDLVVLPRFGRWKVAAVDPDAIARLIRDLEREGLHAVDASRKARPFVDRELPEAVAGRARVRGQARRN